MAGVSPAAKTFTLKQGQYPAFMRHDLRDQPGAS
jgi:hypothetical protein